MCRKGFDAKRKLVLKEVSGYSLAQKAPPRSRTTKNKASAVASRRGAFVRHTSCAIQRAVDGVVRRWYAMAWRDVIESLEEVRRAGRLPL